MSYRGVSSISSIGGQRPSSRGVGQMSSPSSLKEYGRVIDVIIDSSHPKYQEMGASQALYGVFYQPLYEGSTEQVVTYPELRFAYPNQLDVREIPVKGEVVELSSMPSVPGAEKFRYNASINKVCWTRIVPLWNHPHVSLYPDVVRLSGSYQFDSNFIAGKSVRQLQLVPGDLAIEGRYGQSIRFGGTSYGTNLIADSASNSYPYTIIRNGTPDEESNGTLYEDINKDDSSIYLTSNHIVPLVEANRKFAAAVTASEIARNYRGKQIVANSDRIMLNARKDDLELAANTHIGLNGDSVSIDGEKYVGVDANEVYLGTFAKQKQNAVLKGDETVALLENTLKALENLLGTLGSGNADPEVWIPKVQMVAKSTQSSLASFRTRLQSLKSKKVFVE